jgi:hypothetical protein
MFSRRMLYGRLRTSLLIFVLVAVAFVTIGTNMFLASQLPLLLSNNPSEHRVSDRSGSSSGASYGRKVRLSENDHDGMLHIVTTRFMQDQSNLVELGWARMALFETFCLPTMIGQLANNYLWFVMVDPKLNADLLQRLRALLTPYPNFYLVASNAKLLEPQNLTVGSPKYDNLILTGDTEMLYKKMFDFHRPLLVETRLDADDGLHKDTLQEIQKVARQLPVDGRGWQIVCAGIHYEWRNPAIGAVHGEGQTHQDTYQLTSGRLRVVKEKICVTPGYTLVKHRQDESLDFPSWPRKGHHLITRDWPECSILHDGSNPLNWTIHNVSGRINNTVTHNCWRKIRFYPAALRPRTITSAGMSRVVSSTNDTFYENQTDILWEWVQRDFGIQPQKALSTSRYLHEHFVGIALDNLKGQW